MNTTELVLAVLLVVQSVAWMAHDYKHFEPAEFVRRAERGLGVGIREGQANGTVESRDSSAKSMRGKGIGNEAGRNTSSMAKPTDFAPKHELSGQFADGIYAMTDNVSDEQFEEALAEANDEGNLSRANVARKAKAL